MNTYVKNYWSLYLDFLHDFRALTYKGFSLAYFVHFPSLLRSNTALWKDLYNEKFADRLNNKVEDRKEIQAVFDKFIQSHKKPFIKNKHGKVAVVYDTILRLPERTMNGYFNKTNTLFVMAGSKNNKKTSNRSEQQVKTLYDITVTYLSNYKMEKRKAIIQLQNQAKSLFQTYKTNHVYQDKMFQGLLLKKIAEIVNRIEQSICFMGEVPVSCIVVSSTHSYINRILALVAAEKGIPTICMQHGIIANEFGYLPKISTIDAVYGNFEVDWYRRIGVPKESLAIIGHPRFDQAFEAPTLSQRKFCKLLGLDKKKKTLMIVVRGNRDIAKWRTLIETISKKVSLNIVVKDFPSNTHALTSEFPFVYPTKSLTLYDILPHVDAVVSYPSTVGLEAMLANKPLFLLNKKLPSYTGYFNSLGELVQSDPKKLGEMIISYFNDTNWNQYVQKKREDFLREAYPDFSSSGERLKRLINKLI